MAILDLVDALKDRNTNKVSTDRLYKVAKMANLEQNMVYVFKIISALRDKNISEPNIDGNELIFMIDQMIVIYIHIWL